MAKTSVFKTVSARRVFHFACFYIASGIAVSGIATTHNAQAQDTYPSPYIGGEVDPAF